jgi:MFS transporter, SP family, solute carrier family 2 (myo-inositol transporter), member 13
MISIDMIFLGTGSVLANAMDAAFQHVAHGWRYMVALGAVPSILLGIFLFWCPESPRQLMYHNRREECFRVVRAIYPDASEQQIFYKILSIEQSVTQAKALEDEVTIRKGLKNLFTIPANLRALIAGCGLMFFQQFFGFTL